MNNYLPKPGDPVSRDVLKLVHERKRASLEYVRPKYIAAQRWEDAFRGIYTGKVANYLNDITLPLVFSQLMVDVAKKVNGLFGTWPIVSFQGFPDGAGGVARKNELLVNLQLKEADSFRKAVRFFMQADIDGVAVAEVGWTFLQRLRQFRTYIPGTYEIIEVKDQITEFDGPNWNVLDLPDFWPEANKTHIKDMGHYIRRYWTDYDTLLEMNSHDGLQSFDPTALAAVAETGMPAPTSSRDEFFAFSKYRTFNDFLTNRSAFEKPVEIWEMYGTVPSEFAPDGVRQRIITIANGKVVLRNEPDKLLLSRHRIIHYSPTPDPRHFVGIGKAQIIEPLQSAASRLTNQRLDTLDLANKPGFIAAAGAMTSQNMFVKPGKIFPINTKNKNISEVIMPIPIDLQPFQAAFQEVAFLDRMAQKGGGIDDAAVAGLTNGVEMTARQFQGQAEMAMTRLALEAMLAGAEVVEPIAELFRDMNRTMLPLPKQFSMIGTKAIFDPVTGTIIPPETGMISMPHELDHSWSAKAFGPGFMLSKSAQRADALQLVQIMMANPVWIQNLNWLAMARKIFNLFDWDADEMFMQNPIVQQLAAQLGQSPAGAMAATDNPTAALGGASGQMMAPIQKGTEQSDNAPLGVGP